MEKQTKQNKQKLEKQSRECWQHLRKQIKLQATLSFITNQARSCAVLTQILNAAQIQMPNYIFQVSDLL